MQRELTQAECFFSCLIIPAWVNSSGCYTQRELTQARAFWKVWLGTNNFCWEKSRFRKQNNAKWHTKGQATTKKHMGIAIPHLSIKNPMTEVILSSWSLALKQSNYQEKADWVNIVKFINKNWYFYLKAIGDN